MHVTAIDLDQNFFQVTDVFSDDLVKKVLQTPWLDLKYTAQEGQESWARRRIDNSQLAWLPEWEAQITQLWPQLAADMGVDIDPYSGTAFWVDLPGFTCPLHTDGEMPGSLHLTWIGDPGLGTTFYHSKNPAHIRYQVDLQPNSGYAMINMPDSSGYRLLQWHGMLKPVPTGTYRLTSYTWINPRK